MAPQSDIDLLFLMPKHITPRAKSVIEAMLYILWDLHLKVGHSSRTLSDCLKLGAEDFTIRTALLEQRFLVGDKAPAATLAKRLKSELFQGTETEFVAAKLTERDERHERQGERYVVEPNVKEGKGGLRDLQSLFWIAKYIHGVQHSADLVEKGVFRADEYETFKAAENFLWAVRGHLHLLTKRATEQLTFDMQVGVAEAMKYATIDKDQFMGDPNFIDVPQDLLASKVRAAEFAAKIRAGEKADIVRLNSGAPESKDTTHLVVADAAGNVVNVTHSLGSSSGVITEGLGFMYNNCMMVFDPRPGRVGSLAPGKARFTAMCPTILSKDGKPFLALGAPGGTTITMGVLQTILNVVDFSMSAQEAVSAPRFCATSNVIELTNRILRGVERELNQDGYVTRRYAASYITPILHAIRLQDGKLDGGADPAGDGMAAAC